MTLVLLLRGESATPVAANDAFVMSESALLAQFTNVSASESYSLSEGTTAIAVTANRTDAGALAEAIQSIALSGPSDAFTLAEVAAMTITENKVANDAWALAEAMTLQANLSRVDSWALTELTGAISAAIAANDAGSLTEASLLSTVDLKAASDSWSLAEAAVLLVTENKAAADAGTLAEALALSAAVSGLDSWAVSEAAAILADMARTDSWTFTDTSNLLSVDLKVASDSSTVSEVAALLTTDFKAATDSQALGEVAGINATVTANDITNLLENSAINAALLRSDAWSLTELAAAQATVFQAASETHTVAEALGLTANVAANDALALSEVLADLAQTTFKLASDSFSLSESSSLQFIVALTATDSFTLSAEVAGVVEFLEAPYIHHREPLGGIVLPNVLQGTMLLLVDSQGVIIDAVTAGTPTAHQTIGLPQANQGSGVIDAAVAQGVVESEVDDGAYV